MTSKSAHYNQYCMHCIYLFFFISLPILVPGLHVVEHVHTCCCCVNKNILYYTYSVISHYHSTINNRNKTHATCKMSQHTEHVLFEISECMGAHMTHLNDIKCFSLKVIIQCIFFDLGKCFWFIFISLMWQLYNIISFSMLEWFFKV